MKRKHAPLLVLLAPLALATVAAVPPPNLVDAMAAQRALVAAEPYSAPVHNDLGNLLLLAGEPVAAKDAYQRALELDPDLASAHFNLALLLQQQGALRRAANHLDRLLELEPRHAWGWFQLGRTQEELGRESVAIAAYARAFGLDPRLSFHDVNPQVLDSELVTRALLAVRSESLSDAPRSYEDPQRIASLMLPRLPADQPAEPTESTAVRPGAASVAPATAFPPAVEDDVSVKVIRVDDLEPQRRTGEATPATGGSVGVTVTPRESPRERLERRRAAERGEGEERPGTGVQPGFHPSARSTGQIELQVEPEW
ncbi:MAG TPA: tetratricopeptide repeat protein [Thermoanaerobaculia bacterium]|nr:tetratricopeptide repeat protein [Thermoanaerobaculia bacterium]